MKLNKTNQPPPEGAAIPAGHQGDSGTNWGKSIPTKIFSSVRPKHCQVLMTKLDTLKINLKM